MKTDHWKQYHLKSAELAFDFVKTFADQVLTDYEEPTREGTPRGEPIGMSKTKLHAALLMALHPQVLSLKKLGEMIDVSEGVLRVWRTQKEFKEAVEKYCKILGQKLSEMIRQLMYQQEIDSIKNSTPIEIETSEGKNYGSPYGVMRDGVMLILKSEYNEALDLELRKNPDIKKIIILDDEKERIACSDEKEMAQELIRILLKLNEHVFTTFLDDIKGELENNIPGFPFLFLFLHKLLFVTKDKDVKNWVKQPFMVDLLVHYINNGINILTNPDAQKEYGAAWLKDEAERIKQAVSDLAHMVRR